MGWSLYCFETESWYTVLAVLELTEVPHSQIFRSRDRWTLAPLFAYGGCISRKVGYFVTGACTSCYRNSSHAVTIFSFSPQWWRSTQGPQREGQGLNH